MRIIKYNSPKPNSNGGNSSDTASAASAPVGATNIRVTNADDATHAEQADEATHAANADLATQAKNLTPDSTDWQTIANNLQKAIDALKELYLSKQNDDTAAGKIQFEKGFESVIEALFDKGIKIGDYSIDELGNAILNAITAVSAKLKSLTSDSATITNASISNILTDILFKAGAKFAKGLSIGESYSIDSFGNAILDSFKSSNFDEASQTGFSQTKDGLLLKNLTVWGRAIFNSLEIRKVYNVGGVFLASPAGGTIKKVEDKGTFYRCYLLADDGTTRTTNLFEKGDQALCQDFNIKSGVYSNVSNKRYWRKIIDISTDDTLFDDGTGHKFAWVDLSKTDCEATTNDAPVAGDVICSFGNDTDTDRQNAILLDTTSPGAPILALYKGVNAYSLENKDIVVLSPEKVKMIANELHTVSETGVVTDVAKTITDISKSVTDANGAMDTAKAALQKEIDSNSADIKTNAGTITSQGTQIQQTNGSIATLAGRVTTTEKGITSNSTAIQQNSDSLGALSKRVTTSEKGISDNTAAITQNANNIKLKVSQTDYDSNNKAVQSQFSQISQKADDISLAVNNVSTKVDDIQIGGRNLLLKSETFGSIYQSNNKHTISGDTAKILSDGGENWFSFTYNANIGTTYVVSIWVLSVDIDKGINLPIYSDGSWYNYQYQSNPGEWVQLKATITPKSVSQIQFACDNYHNTTGYIEFKHPKIEIGNKATDWSPAPEDVSQDAADKSNSALQEAKTYTDGQIKVTNDTISSKVSKTDYNSNNTAIQGQFTQITQKYNSISLTVNDVSNKADSASSTASTANATANSANSKADTINTGLTRTGIDIASHVITATANNFKIKNNSGAVTFSIDSAGNLVGAGNAQFNGKVVATTFNTANNTFVVDSAGNITCNGGTFNNIKVNGSIRSPFTFSEDSLNTEYTDNVSLFGVQESSYTMYQLPWDVSQNGRHITLTNYKSDQNGVSRISLGRINIGAPSGKYFFENGKAKNTLIFSREVVELVGYGDSNTFYGWIVLGRTDLMPNHVYGKSLKALAMGQVDFHDYDNVTINAIDFTGSSDFRVIRSGEAYFHVILPSTILTNDYTDYMILLTGIGMCFKRNWDPVKATLWAKGSENGLAYFDVLTSDGGANRDGSFEFIVINPNDFVD